MFYQGFFFFILFSLFLSSIKTLMAFRQIDLRGNKRNKPIKAKPDPGVTGVNKANRPITSKITPRIFNKIFLIDILKRYPHQESNPGRLVKSQVLYQLSYRGEPICPRQDSNPEIDVRSVA